LRVLQLRFLLRRIRPRPLMLRAGTAGKRNTPLGATEVDKHYYVKLCSFPN
jgi:hypothetical protein